MNKLIGLAVILFGVAANAVNVDFKAFNTNQFNTNGLKITLKRAVALEEVFSMYPFSQATNVWLDFGRTNSYGERLIYGTMTATNNVYFNGLSNCVRGSLLSFNVLAGNTNRLLSISTNLVPHPDTNIWTLAGTRYQILLRTNHEARLSFQSNDTLSVICYLPEQ